MNSASSATLLNFEVTCAGPESKLNSSGMFFQATPLRSIGIGVRLPEIMLVNCKLTLDMIKGSRITCKRDDV